MPFPFQKISKPFRIVIILAVLITALQFVQRPVANPLVAHPLQAPADVINILQRACYDCHSNVTNLRWYDKIAPVSWFVNAHVKEARQRFNFSTWDTLSAADQQGRFWEIVNMAIAGKMPLTSYTTVHPQANLSVQDIEVLQEYAREMSPAKYQDTSVINQAEKEFHDFQQGNSNNRVPVAANGVAYVPDYQNWQIISTTNRFDNHSIRILYGNDIAVKAIRDNHTHPFPEGSTVVKAVWNSIESENGDIVPGSLNSIQIMTKNSTQFPDSKGWGFAKFNGIQLVPYGHTPLFNSTCYNCHKIADNNDYIFNLPLQNEAGVRPMFDAGNLKVITTFANRKQKTMSVLYGNEAARKSAMGGYQTHVAGEIFELVTFKQEDNTHWYGSYINGAVQSIENLTATGTDAKSLIYRLVQGKAPLNTHGQPMTGDERIIDILAHRPSVFP